MNPMREFIHRDDRHVDEAFHHFTRSHNKNYHDRAMHEKRKHNFRQNLRLVATLVIFAVHVLKFDHFKTLSAIKFIVVFN